MDKKLLKTILGKLSREEQITLNLRGDLVDKSGLYAVVNVAKGKGKGGSLILEALNTETNQTLIIGTPRSDDVLNITVKGETYGYTSETDVPMVFVANKSFADQIKTSIKNMGSSAKVKLSSEQLPELNGTFKVLDRKTSKGRGGQIILTLQNTADSETVEFWSYRHSGVIQTFEIV